MGEEKNTENEKFSVWVVLLGGACGGLLFWALNSSPENEKDSLSALITALLSDNPSQKIQLILTSLFKSALVGASSAFILIFLIMYIDAKNRPRLFALALVGGLVWQPILQTASDRVGGSGGSPEQNPSPSSSCGESEAQPNQAPKPRRSD